MVGLVLTIVTYFSLSKSMESVSLSVKMSLYTCAIVARVRVAFVSSFDTSMFSGGDLLPSI